MKWPTNFVGAMRGWRAAMLWPVSLDRDTAIGLLAAGPAGWTTLGALLGVEPGRAAMITAFGLHPCWNLPGPCVRADRQQPACLGCRNQ